jgi:hypothetical protein
MSTFSVLDKGNDPAILESKLIRKDMKTSQKRNEIAEQLIKNLVEKAKARSLATTGEVDYAFVTGYLASSLQFVATASPASMRQLEELL